MAGEARRRRVRTWLRLAGIRSVGELGHIELALRHGSFARERGGESNERLEFLGDSVLGFIVATWLYEMFPTLTEGELTIRKARIVKDEALAVTAARLGFDDAIELGVGMRNAGGTENASILANTFEAFVAALYLQFGIEAARKFVLEQHVARVDLDPLALVDPKTRLQQYTQAHALGLPSYDDRGEGTPQHPAFTSTVVIDGRPLGSGSGASKRAAQQAAAIAALRTLESASGAQGIS